MQQEVSNFFIFEVSKQPIILLDAQFEILKISSYTKNQLFGSPKAPKNLRFEYLVADEDKKVINAYGVWGPKKFMGREYEGIHRVTFVIDESGLIEKIFTKVKTKDHTAQILG